MWQRATAMLSPLRDDVLEFATSTGPYSSGIQYLALKALIWLQVGDAISVVLDEGLSERFDSREWMEDPSRHL